MDTHLELDPEMESSGLKGQNSLRSTLEGTAVLMLPRKKKDPGTHVRMGNLNPFFKSLPRNFKNVANRGLDTLHLNWSLFFF